MSKARAAAKFGTAGGVTALYGIVVYRSLRGLLPQQREVSSKGVAIVAGGLAVLTWVAALA